MFSSFEFIGAIELGKYDLKMEKKLRDETFEMHVSSHWLHSLGDIDIYVYKELNRRFKNNEG